MHLRCRKYRKEKCLFRLTLRRVNIVLPNDPVLPGHFDPKKFTVVPGKHSHICQGYNSEVEAVSSREKSGPKIKSRK